MSLRWKILLLLNMVAVGAMSQENVKEEVYLHLNSADLLVGETLHYSAFVRSEASGKLSSLSKFLYVELLDEKGSVIHQAKLAITDGRGAGKYFVPSLLKSGAYHLTAYTRWMRNWGEYFQTSIHVINPYEELKRPDEDQTLQLRSFMQDNQLIMGTENTFSIQVMQGRRPAQLKGRVLASDDAAGISFITNEAGVAQASFTPKKGVTYQIILEGSEGFKFFDLQPACSDCASLEVKVVEEQITADLRAGPNFTKRTMRFELHSSQQVLVTKDWPTSGPLRINRAELPEATLRALLIDERDTLSEVIFLNGDRPVVDLSSAKTTLLNHREQVSRGYQLVPGTSASVSVSRIEDSFHSTVDLTAHHLLSNVHNALDLRQIEPDDYQHFQRTSRWTKSIVDREDVRWLPEYRSDLIEGIVTNREDKGESDLSIALSIPSQPYQLRIAQSTSNGTFLLDYDSEIRMDRAVFDVFENAKQRETTEEGTSSRDISQQLPLNTNFSTIDVDEKYRLFILDEFYANYPEDLPTTPLVFDSARVRSYIQRSVYNQIENAYYDLSPDTLLVGVPQVYGFRSYRLDDFTRFPTMRDTFIEFVPFVGVSKNEQNFRINLRTETDYEHRQAGGESILLIDGVLVTSEAVLSISPYLVERIDVLSKKYFFGKKMFDGIIALHTYGGDAWDTPSKSRQVSLTPTQPYQPTEAYATPTDRRHADYRTHLSWQPLRIVPEDGMLDISFWTSQVPGDYQLEIQGITPDGRPVTVKETFRVSSNAPEN
ncbi:MAG: hypothetical protein AAGA85_15605 [Bacteroidota bacterium]